MSDAIEQKVAAEVERVTTQAALALARLFSEQVDEAVFSERSACVQIIQDEMTKLEGERPFDEELWGKLRDLRERMQKRGESA